mmetsp:Transcript_9994/g.22368  ORF Transcript_9994/g.22368 Transcript_9994/m.22368 type:complete len:217 (+) Transcript_9994:1590-2240(+)
MHSGFNFRSFAIWRSAFPQSVDWAAFRRMESPACNFVVWSSKSMYAATIEGMRQICSGVSSSIISGGILRTSSSWQMSKVRAVPMGRCAVNFVGLGSTNTAISGLISSHRLPTCSTRPTPVDPKHVPGATSHCTICASTGTAIILTKISSWSKDFFNGFAFTCTCGSPFPFACGKSAFEAPSTCCTGPWCRSFTANSAALKSAVFMKSLSVITISL